VNCSDGLGDFLATSKDGILVPLRDRQFRSFWVANIISNLGWLVQGVAAAWLMTALTSSAEKVALVQAMTQLPMVVVALLAGVVADLWDRRRVLIAAQLWMLAVSVALAFGAGMELVNPATLLVATFLLGAGAAVNAPTFQVVVVQLLRPELLAAAVTINAVAFNLARAVGPALGGTIIAAAGVHTAFLFNALSYLPLLAVLLFYRSPKPVDDVPRERMGAAIATGMRYVIQTPSIWHAMGRGALFGFAAPAVLALLPLIARDQLGGGPMMYGVLLGGFGLGALGGAFLMQPLRSRLGADRVASLLTGINAATLITLGYTDNVQMIMLVLVISGGCWLGAFSSFNISVQLASAPWVQARVLAIYQMIQNAGMALGSWIWGVVAEAQDVPSALVLAGLAMLGGLFLAPLLALSTEKPPDFTPAERVEPKAELAVPEDEGPILVQYEYRIAASAARDFAAAMDELSHARQRNGALRWRLFQDLADPDHWVESFLIADWLALKRFYARASTADVAIEGAAKAFQIAGEAITIRTMLARRHDSRFELDRREKDAVRRGPT